MIDYSKSLTQSLIQVVIDVWWVPVFLVVVAYVL
jgi:hypothetical protein